MTCWLRKTVLKATARTPQAAASGLNGGPSVRLAVADAVSDSPPMALGGRAPAGSLLISPIDGTARRTSVGPIPAAIHLRGITKLYQTPAGLFAALRGIDLRVESGEFVAVVGKSGSGKSTLINMFTGIDHPTEGEVIVAGTRICELDEGQMAQWRGRTLGIVFQFFQLLPTLTLVENVMLPMDLCHSFPAGERYDRAQNLLEQVGLAEQAHKFPSAVAGGHQQRAAIARALANDPPIVVADEPTGNLDSRAAEAIFGLFEALVGRGKTILMVTHDDELAARVPRTVILADGLIEDDVLQAQPAR